MAAERLAEIERQVDAADMHQRSRFWIEPLAHQLDKGRAIAGRGGDGIEAQPFGGRGGGVADGQDRPAALLARFGERARAVGAGQQDGLAGGEGRREVGGRMKDFETEQRRDDRHVAALAERRGQRHSLAFRAGDQHAHRGLPSRGLRPTQC